MEIRRFSKSDIFGRTVLNLIIVLIGKPLILFLGTVSLKLGRRKLVVSRVFGVKTWNPWRFHWNRGPKARPPCFNEYLHGVSSFYPQKHVNTAKSSPSFTEYRAKKKNMRVFHLKPRIWWFLAKKQLILGPWNQVTKKNTKMSHLSVKPQKFHRNWLSTNLKPPEVSKKLPHFDFTKRNRPSSIKTDTSQNCRQQPSWICRHVFFTQTR